MREIRKKRFCQSQGMTLIEIMIVVAIIGGIMGLGAMVLFPGDEVKVRKEASRLAGTIKFLYNEAAIKNKFFRLAFNLDENSYYVESSSEPYFVKMEDEEEEKLPTTLEGEEGEEGSEEGGPTMPTFSAEEGYLTKPVKFPTGIIIRDVIVMHSKERNETGIVYTYFLPNGWAEPLVVNLSDEDEENFYSLEVNPLTGKSKIRAKYLEIDPETFRAEEEQ